MERRLKLKKILTRFVAHCESSMQDIETVVLVIRFFLVKFFFRERKSIVLHLYFSLIIVKSLQLRRRRQIAEPRKCYLVCVIFFPLACVFFILFLTGWEFRVNSLQ